MSYEAITAAIGACLALLNGWVIFGIRNAREDAAKQRASTDAEITELRAADAKLTQGMADIRELLLGHYVERAEFKEDMKDQSAQFKDVIERSEARIMTALANSTASAASAAATASAAAVAAALAAEHTNKR